jgi:hypothetical protein
MWFCLKIPLLFGFGFGLGFGGKDVFWYHGKICTRTIPTIPL